MTESQKQAAVGIYGKPLTPEEGVRHILSTIRNEGDTALRAWTQKFDGEAPAEWRIGPSEFAAALERIPPALRAAFDGR